jgi:hypothetical protein
MTWSTKEGEMASESHLFFDQQSQVVNEVADMFNVAMVAPSKTTAEITALEPDAQVGALWFNSTLGKLQVKVAAGTIETVTST